MEGEVSGIESESSRLQLLLSHKAGENAIVSTPLESEVVW